MKTWPWIMAAALAPSPLSAQSDKVLADKVLADKPIPVTISSHPVAEVVFPAGSRIGMIPFPGSTPAEGFQGFVDEVSMRSVMIIELPAEARSVPLKEFVSNEGLKSQGVTAIVRRNFKLADGASMVDAIEVRANQTAQGRTFPKCLVVFHTSDFTGLISAQMPNDKSGDACTLIKGLSIQASVSDEDKLAALPFTLTDLGGLKVWQTIGGSSVILSNGDEMDDHVADSSPMVIVARAFADRNIPQTEQINFSVESLKVTADYGAAKIVSQQMVAGAPVPTSEVIAESGDKKVAQWIQFQPDGYTIRIIAEAPKAGFDAALPHFKAIANGVTPRKSSVKK